MEDRDALARKALERVKRLMGATGWTATRLAREAGVSPSTLTRFVKNPHSFVPTTRTFDAIERAAARAAEEETSEMPIRTPGRSPVTLIPARGIGSRLTATRIALGHADPGDFAARVGMEASRVGGLEAETIEITIDDLLRLRAFEGVPADWILFGDMSALSQRLAQRIVTLGNAPGAPEAAWEARDQMRSAQPSRDRTLHESVAGALRRTIAPPE